MTSHDRIVVFDFDGTVSVGHGPVRSYARFIADTLGSAAAGFLASVEAGLAPDAAGPPAPVDGEHPIDGYDLVRLLAEKRGVSPATRDRAYLQSRRQLATDAARITAPTGLREFLAEARRAAHLVLATNSPAIRLDEALEVLGLAGAFDAVYTSVGKPDGFESLLDDLQAQLATDASPARSLLSVGDVWPNDLAPAHRRGASTALIGAWMAPAGAAQPSPTFQAATLPGLYPALRDWLAQPTEPSPSAPASNPSHHAEPHPIHTNN